MASSNGYSNGRNDENHSAQRLRSLPLDLLQKDQSVSKLNLEKNKLKNIPEISRLSNLTELNLARNEFTEFPVSIQELKHLVKLYMNQNNIKVIPENIFPSLKKLQFLKISTNRLDRLPQDINMCVSLTYLNLSNNNLKDLDPLVGLGGLKELYVEKNRLKALPRRLFETECLEKIKANGNPLQKPPEEVCTGGLKEIQSYFEMLKASSYNVCTVKTMFLGSTMAGKTTLSSSLRLGKPVHINEADRTVGIEISEVNRDGIHFRFWDFAGQEVYYLTHHAFITPQALVILAIDLSTYNIDNPESFKSNVRFWISNIQLKVPNAVVLLVGTHVDGCEDEAEVQQKKEDIEGKVKQMLYDRRISLEQRKQNVEKNSEQENDIEQLAENELNVLDLIPIDCTKPEDIRKLQDHISDFVSDKNKSPFNEETLPQYYKDVETAIQEMLNNEDIPQHGITNQEEILHHLKESHHELNREKLQSILKYLHRIGVIMWYIDIPALHDMVFAKPSFLISLFKAIVRHNLVSKMEEISRPDLISENALQKHKETWIDDYTRKATLSNIAIRILMRKELGDLDLNDKDLIEEIVGTDKEAGSILTLLQHFEVCLPSKSAKLNPRAVEFNPNTKWEPRNNYVYKPNGECLFPNKLETSGEVTAMWGQDNLEDIHVKVYIVPEIPHGLFHRLVIRACSIYSNHWIEKDLSLFSCGNRRVLLKNQPDDGDQFIEIRSKDSDLPTSKDIQKAWDMIKVIMMRLSDLLQQWRGLCSYVHSPCRQHGCTCFFEWENWHEWLDPNVMKFNVDPEKKMTCRNGHTRETKRLLPIGTSEDGM